MGVFFAKHSGAACCLCGSTEALTGEHKIKASNLRAEFGGAPMLISEFDTPEPNRRLAQGPKSKVLHFDAPLCGPCNNARTQRADREFDRFAAAARTLLDDGGDPAGAFNLPRYAVGSEAYHDVFRYFAKRLCCHMAETGAPRRFHMARYAMGLHRMNCVWLAVDRDWTFSQMEAAGVVMQYAAHGGLLIYADKKSHLPNAIHSTLTVGPLRFVFHSRFTWPEMLELGLCHQSFVERCRESAKEAVDSPLEDHQRLRLGLQASEGPADNSG